MKIGRNDMKDIKEIEEQLEDTIEVQQHFMELGNREVAKYWEGYITALRWALYGEVK